MVPKEHRWSTPRHVNLRVFEPANSDFVCVVKCDNIYRGGATTTVRNLPTEITGIQRPRSTEVAVEILDNQTLEYRAIEDLDVETYSATGYSDGEDAAPPPVGTALNEPPQALETSEREEDSASGVIPFSNFKGKRVLVRQNMNVSRGVKDNDLFTLILPCLSEFLDCLPGFNQPNSTVAIAHTLINRREAALMSCKLQKDDEAWVTPRIGFLWQFSSSPRKAICLTFSLNPHEDTVTIHCSCNPPVSLYHVPSRTCIHSKILKEDDSIVQRISSILKENCDRYFPKLIILQSDDVMRSFELKRILAADLSIATMERLLSWSFSVVFDNKIGVFVPVYKHPGKPFDCQMCRGMSERRGNCKHELCCNFDLTKKLDSGVEDDENVHAEGHEFSDGENDNSEDLDCEVMSNTFHFPTLPPLMCKSIIQRAELLSLRIKERPSGSNISFCPDSKIACPSCGKFRSDDAPVAQRQMFLATLTQGTPVIEVSDWHCTDCNEDISYTGSEHSIFPAFEYLAYTYELLYKWFEMVCYRGYSFRAAYGTTRSFVDTPTTKIVIHSSGHAVDMDTFLNLNPGGRRRANDAFRAFVSKVDLTSPAFTQKLFSCPKCEQPLTEADKLQLGITDEGLSSSLTRLKAVVIDGTAAGILKKLPDYKRNQRTLPSIRVSLRKSLLSGKVRKCALREFCRLARSAARISAKDESTSGKRISFPLNSHKRGKSKRAQLITS